MNIFGYTKRSRHDQLYTHMSVDIWARNCLNLGPAARHWINAIACSYAYT